MLMILQRARRALIWLKNECIRPYYGLRMSKIGWNYLNRKSISTYLQYRSTAAPLTPERARVIRELESNGVAITTLEDLGFPPDLLEKLQAYTESLRPNASVNKKKTFWLKLWDTIPVLDFHNPFVSVCLSPGILDVVNGYLGLFSKFYYYSLHITKPVLPGEEPRNSQNWHRDPEDKKMCKFFIYLNDVDEASGPFMYVQGSNIGGKWRGLYPQRPPAGRYPPIGRIEEVVPKTDLRVCTGKAGTVIFADTSGFHKGGYATEKERIMFMAGYISKASPRGVFYTYGSDSMKNLSGMEEPARIAAMGNRVDATGEMH
jgi:hypothetical protein